MDPVPQNIFVRTLRWSEKYTRTDMVYLASNGSWLVGGQIVATVSAFALGVVLANALPKEVYGTYKFLLSIAGILSAFTLPGINMALLRAVARGHERSIHAATSARIRWGGIGSVIGLAMAGYYLYAGNTTLAAAVLIISIFLPFFDTFTTISSFLQGRKNFRMDAKWNGGLQLIATIALIVAAFATHNIYILALVYFASYTLLRIGYYYIVLSRLSLIGGEEPGMISYGRHLSFMSALGLIAAQIDKVLLFHYLGAVQVAVYAVATSVPENVKGLLRNMTTIATPKFAELEEDQIRASLPAFWRKFFLFALFTTVILVGYLILAPYVLPLLFPKYPEVVAYSLVYALTFYGGTLTVLPKLFQSQRRTKELYIVNTVPTVLQILLIVALIPFYGLWGAVFARVIGTAISFVITGYLVHRIYH